GMSGLESCFGAVSSIIDDTEKMITMMYAAPRKILGLELPEIKAGAKACLTLFNPDAEFTFEENMILSSSRNNAFKGKTLKGKVFGIVNKNQIILNHS
ncbi:MAG: dihydroorotase, partial [Planctomycetota bacterium]